MFQEIFITVTITITSELLSLKDIITVSIIVYIGNIINQYTYHKSEKPSKNTASIQVFRFVQTIGIVTEV